MLVFLGKFCKSTKWMIFVSIYIERFLMSSQSLFEKWLTNPFKTESLEFTESYLILVVHRILSERQFKLAGQVSLFIQLLVYDYV